MSSMGKARDLDGTIDRVPDPPDEMWALLFMIQCKVSDENINLEALFEVCQPSVLPCIGPASVSMPSY